MNSFTHRAFCAAMLLCMTGCINSTTGRPLSQNLEEGVYYVAKQENDSRGLEKDIAEQLRARGLNAVSGEQANIPPDTTYVVNYLDRWQWDMRMYLIELRIEVRNRSDSTILGYGESKQSSLAAMGKSHVDVINRALDELLIEP